MIIKKSDIKYIHFGVIDINFKCNLPKEKEVIAIAMDLDVDLSYDICKIEGERNIFQIVIDLKLTTPNNNPGYNIYLKPYAVFELPKTEDKNIIDKMLIFTCIPLLLGSARGFIADTTAQFPLGKYFLPSLDMKSILAANPENPGIQK